MKTAGRRCCCLMVALAATGGCTARTGLGRATAGGDFGGSGLSLCGNQLLDAGEGCDDGNTEPSDGCSSACSIEAGWHCGGAPALCRPDGRVYRSAELGATSALATGGGNPLSVVGSLLTFTVALPNDDVGVGDVVRYGAGDEFLAFIEGRLSARQFLARDGLGRLPRPTTTPDDQWEVFRAYTSLADAESGLENSAIGYDFDSWTDGADLVAADLVWNIACYGGGSDTGLVVEDWTTDSSHYLRIFTPHSPTEVGRTQRHAGTWDDARYHASTSAESPFDIKANYVRLEGLQGQLDANTTYEAAVFRIRDVGTDAGEVWISHCIGRQINKVREDNWLAGLGLYEDVEGVDEVSLRAFNNLFYDFDGPGNATGQYQAGMHVNSLVPSYVYATTIVDCFFGINGWGRTTSVKNVLMQHVVDSFWEEDAYFESTNNLTHGVDFVPGTNVIRGSVVFVDYDADDFHLAPSDTLARNAGADLSSDAFMPVSDDVDGDIRSGVFDIGADEGG